MPRKGGGNGPSPKLPNKYHGLIIVATQNGFALQKVAKNVLPNITLGPQTWVAQDSKAMGDLVKDALDSLDKD